MWEADPVVTELEAFRDLRDLLQDDPRLTYVALPWSAYLNRTGTPSRAISSCAGRGAAFTVCQHVSFRNMIGSMKSAGVSVVFTPHARTGEDIIDGVRIFGFPHFPVTWRDQVADPDILFSFVGAPTAPVRRRIVERLEAWGSVRLRDAWHFGTATSQREEERTDYEDLLSRSVFSLCPRGTGPSSLRIWEALASGVVPVIIADDLQLPWGIDWHRCSIRLAENDIDSIPDLLAAEAKENHASLKEGVKDARAVLRKNFAFPVRKWMNHA